MANATTVSPDMMADPKTDPKDPKTVFAGMGDGSRGFGFNPKEKGHGALYVTRDRGESWEPILVESPSILTVSVAAN